MLRRLRAVANEFHICAVPSDLVKTVWDSKIDIIRRGLKHGMSDTTSELELFEAVMEGSQQIWTIEKDDEIQAIIIVGIYQFPETKKISVNMVAGRNLSGWADEIEVILLALKDMVGADSIESACRLGSAKFLADRGWKKKAIIMELR